MTMRVTFDVAALDAAVDAMDTRLQQNARAAAQAGAEVFYRAVKQNVAAIGRARGNLAAAIYQAFVSAESNERRAVYDVTWNNRKAPHGYWLEYGFIRRYATYVGKDGKWHAAVRGGKRGTKQSVYVNASGTHLSGRSEAQRAAYYVPLPQPVQMPAKAFIRSAWSRRDEAYKAMEERLYQGFK